MKPGPSVALKKRAYGHGVSSRSAGRDGAPCKVSHSPRGAHGHALLVIQHNPSTASLRYGFVVSHWSLRYGFVVSHCSANWGVRPSSMATKSRTHFRASPRG